MRSRVSVVWLGITLWVVGTAAAAGPSAGYPIKPVAVVVGWPPGQAIDLVARALVEAARPYFPAYVLNRPGGAGTIAAAEVVLARPDGYTIGMTALAVMAVQPHLTDLPYKGPDDYQPILKIGGHAVVLAVRADARWRSILELLEYARANPRGVRVASPGVGTINHINLELLREKANIDLVHVPMAGAGEYIPALLGGHVEVVVGLPVEVLPHLRAGRVRVLAVFSGKKNPLLPGIPILPEIGYDITTEIYHFLFAPRGTPGRRVQVIHSAFKRAVDSEAFRKFAQENSYVVDYMGPEELKRQLERDHAFLGGMVRKLKLR